jgi:archaellum component FlaD/FlaE
VIGVEEGRSVQRAGRVGGSSVRCRLGGMGENGVARAETEQEQEQRERKRGEEEEEEEEEAQAEAAAEAEAEAEAEKQQQRAVCRRRQSRSKLALEGRAASGVIGGCDAGTVWLVPCKEG